jgi:hypothetical protein
VATVISHRLATLHELQTFYGAEDLYGMLEIIAVDTHNQHVMQSQRES